MIRKSPTLSIAILAGFTCATAIAAAEEPAARPTDTAASPDALEEIQVVGRFLDTSNTSAMKLKVPVLDTPFSVSSYSAAFLKSLESVNLQDNYNYMNGVKKAGQTAYDLTIRGFKTGGDDKNAIMVDGLPGLTTRFSSPLTVGLDHVELVKGPMSVLYGQIQPGGFINMITKKPQPVASQIIDIQAQSYAANDEPKFGKENGLTGSVDLTGPIDDGKTLLYRFVGEIGNRDGFRDFTDERDFYFTPSLSWKITDSTIATLAYEYRRTAGSFDTGVIAPGTPAVNAAGAYTGAVIPATTVGFVPRTTRYQEPGDYRTETGRAISASLDHRFGNGVAWNTAFRSVDSDSYQDEHSPTGQAVTTTKNAATTPNFTTDPPGTLYIVRRARRLATGRTYDFLDSNLTGDFDTGWIGHKLVAGINGGRDTTNENRFGFISGSGCTGIAGGLTAAQCGSMNIAVYDPVYGLVDPAVATAPYGSAADKINQTFTHFSTNSLGGYVSDLMALAPQWKLSLGLRTAHERTRTREDRAINTDYRASADKAAIPSVGLLYEPTHHWTVYTSFSESYVPAQAAYLNSAGQPGTFTPITGKQVEAGVKTENLFEDRLSASMAAFQIKRLNTLIAVANSDQIAYFGKACTNVPAGETCYYQGTEEESKGVEFELNARPLPNWQTTFGYSFLDATISKAPIAAQTGARLLNTAKNSANLYSSYDIPSGWARGLGIRLGVVYTGDRAGTLPTASLPTVLLLPSYLTVDVGLNYAIDRYVLNLKVANVLDRTYYESIGQGTNGVNQLAPGAPRLVTLSMRTTF
jgi:iron complex outermembrane receptor protein